MKKLKIFLIAILLSLPSCGLEKDRLDSPTSSVSRDDLKSILEFSSQIYGWEIVEMRGGTSMLPFIHKDSTMIAFENVNYDQISVGDIIIGECGNSTFLHQVIKINLEGIWTKGYNCSGSDWCPTKKEKIWRVVIVGYFSKK